MIFPFSPVWVIDEFECQGEDMFLFREWDPSFLNLTLEIDVPDETPKECKERRNAWKRKKRVQMGIMSPARAYMLGLLEEL